MRILLASGIALLLMATQTTIAQLAPPFGGVPAGGSIGGHRDPPAWWRVLWHSGIKPWPVQQPIDHQQLCLGDNNGRSSWLFFQRRDSTVRHWLHSDRGRLRTTDRLPSGLCPAEPPRNGTEPVVRSKTFATNRSKNTSAASIAPSVRETRRWPGPTTEGRSAWPTSRCEAN